MGAVQKNKSTAPHGEPPGAKHIVAQCKDILQLRRMLQQDGLNKRAYYQYDAPVL